MNASPMDSDTESTRGSFSASAIKTPDFIREADGQRVLEIYFPNEAPSLFKEHFFGREWGVSKQHFESERQIVVDFLRVSPEFRKTCAQGDEKKLEQIEAKIKDMETWDTSLENTYPINLPPVLKLVFPGMEDSVYEKNGSVFNFSRHFFHQRAFISLFAFLLIKGVTPVSYFFTRYGLNYEHLRDWKRVEKDGLFHYEQSYQLKVGEHTLLTCTYKFALDFSGACAKLVFTSFESEKKPLQGNISLKLRRELSILQTVLHNVLSAKKSMGNPTTQSQELVRFFLTFWESNEELQGDIAHSSLLKPLHKETSQFFIQQCEQKTDFFYACCREFDLLKPATGWNRFFQTIDGFFQKVAPYVSWIGYVIPSAVKRACIKGWNALCYAGVGQPAIQERYSYLLEARPPLEEKSEEREAAIRKSRSSSLCTVLYHSSQAGSDKSFDLRDEAKLEECKTDDTISFTSHDIEEKVGDSQDDQSGLITTSTFITRKL